MKALAVFSGGLDSMLAAAIVRAQGIEVVGVNFETPFFSSARARRSADLLQLPLKVVDLTEAHLQVVKDPRHGHGANMNPCIDCHTLMISETGKMLDREGASFIITGEVLGQRPMSQNKGALALVARESGFGPLVLRPLSARLLPPTDPEREGWVRREDLLDFSGRSRKPQMEMARKLGIHEYPAPAGGCLLTDVIFSRRLKDLIAHSPLPEIREIELLKVGRHFRVGSHAKLVVGRNHRENDKIRLLAQVEDLLLRTESVPGPTALVVGEISPEAEEMCASVTAAYSDAREGETIKLQLSWRGEEKSVTLQTPSKSEFRDHMIG